MKTCLRLTLCMCLLLPTLTAAAEKIVRVPNPCEAGKAFTIKIPVRFPENMTVQYAWYRNDTLIDDTHKLLLGEKAIAYTIPADKAFGSAVYHFTYKLDDKHYEWSRSPVYLVSFEARLEGDCSNGLSAGGSISVSVASCSNELSTGGNVSVGAAPCSNGISTGGSVSAAPCSNGLSTGGSISVGATSCSNGLSTGGSISVGAAPCSNGISTGGSVSAAPCSNGLSTGGSISVVAR